MRGISSLGFIGIIILCSIIQSPCKGQPTPMQYKPITHTRFKPEKVEKISNAHYFITFGKTYFAKLELRLKATDTDTVIVKLGEKSLSQRGVDTNPPGTVRFLTDTLILTKGWHTYQIEIPDFEPPAWAKSANNHIVLPESVGNLLPFRFVEISGYRNRLTRDDLSQIAYYYPFNDEASSCFTSNPKLNQVWELCKHSIKATSFAGVYIDGDRERRPYEGDAYINQLSHYAVDAEYALTRKTIEHLFNFPTWPTEWPLHMPLMLWEDFQYTGNSEYLSLYYDSLKQIIARTSLNEYGLLVNDRNNDIIDWPAGERDGYQISKVNNVPNAFYNKSLQLLAQIAGILNKPTDSIEFAAKAQQHRITFNKQFWNPATGLYVDATDNKHSSLHANIFPIAFDLASTEQMNSIRPFVKSKGMAVSVYGAQYLLEALYVMGEADYALDLLTAENDRSWVNMIKCGGTITWEAWNEQAKPNLDWNHAWATAPANILVRQIVGIRPLEPGFDQILIQPQLGRLKKGRVVHPTLNGLVEVRFNNRSQSVLKLKLKQAMPGQLILPLADYDPKQLKLNNMPVKPLIRGNQIIVTLEAGKNRLSCGKKKLIVQQNQVTRIARPE